MTISVGVGLSKETDAFKAGREAAVEAKLAAREESADLIIVFNSVSLSGQMILKGIRQIFGTTNIIGCSGAGIISSLGIEQEGVVVMAIKSASLKLTMGLAKDLSQDGRRAGQEVAKQSLTKLGGLCSRNLLMLFADGLAKQKGIELIGGIQEVLGSSFPIIGAASADNLQFRTTYQYYRNSALMDSVVGLLWAGNVTVGIGIRHGWKPLGKPRMVSASSGNIIKEIEGKQAISIYEDYFGDEVNQLRQESLSPMSLLYPLGIYVPGEEEYLLRNIISVDEKGWISCQGEVPDGSEIRLMMGTKDSCLEAAKLAALEARKNLKKEIKLAFIFDSVSRYKLLGRRFNEEIALVKQILGEELPCIGFYTYGEYAPLRAIGYLGRCHFHNETIAIVLIGE